MGKKLQSCPFLYFYTQLSCQPSHDAKVKVELFAHEKKLDWNVLQ